MNIQEGGLTREGRKERQLVLEPERERNYARKATMHKRHKADTERVQSRRKKCKRYREYHQELGSFFGCNLHASEQQQHQN